MAVPATSESEAEDFKGLFDKINNADLQPEYAEIQTNLEAIIVGQIVTRPGMRQIVFED